MNKFTIAFNKFQDLFTNNVSYIGTIKNLKLVRFKKYDIQQLYCGTLLLASYYCVDTV